MQRNALYTAVFLALAAGALGAAPQAGAPLPIPPGTPIRAAHMRFDPATGTYVRVPDTIGLGSEPTIYDNTCSLGNVLPLLSAAQNGGAESRAAGDWGAIPGAAYPGDATCVTGCDSDYDIDSFTIGYCTVTAAPVSAIVHFWDIPQSSCTGSTLIGGVTPPATPPLFSASLTGLPRAPVPGPMACYQVTIDLPHPTALRIRGGDNIIPGATFGDRFAWSIQMPGTTGQDGPLIAGQPIAPPCSYCTGTIWEVGNQSPQPGTGFGQDNHVFTDDYGGTIPASDCVQFPGGNPWAGLYLELASSKVCSLAVAASNFCDASDGSAAFCPCMNPGTNNTGCDNAQGTGGVGVQVVAQDPVINRATLLGFGFPMGTSPAAVVIRADALDPAAPIVFGDGLRCIGTPLVRLAGTLASGGSSLHAIGHSAMAGPGFFYYQIWYRNQPAGFCNLLPGTLAYNLSNGQRIFWMQ